MARDLASLLLERSGYQGQSGYWGEVDPEEQIPGAFDRPLGRGANEEFALLRRTPTATQIEALMRGMGLKPTPAGGNDWNLPKPKRVRDLAIGD